MSFCVNQIKVCMTERHPWCTLSTLTFCGWCEVHFHLLVQAVTLYMLEMDADCWNRAYWHPVDAAGGMLQSYNAPDSLCMSCWMANHWLYQASVIFVAYVEGVAPFSVQGLTFQYLIKFLDEIHCHCTAAAPLSNSIATGHCCAVGLFWGSQQLHCAWSHSCPLGAGVYSQSV